MARPWHRLEDEARTMSGTRIDVVCLGAPHSVTWTWREGLVAHDHPGGEPTDDDIVRVLAGGEDAFCVSLRDGWVYAAGVGLVALVGPDHLVNHWRVEQRNEYAGRPWDVRHPDPVDPEQVFAARQFLGAQALLAAPTSLRHRFVVERVLERYAHARPDVQDTAAEACLLAVGAASPTDEQLATFQQSLCQPAPPRVFRRVGG